MGLTSHLQRQKCLNIQTEQLARAIWKSTFDLNYEVIVSKEYVDNCIYILYIFYKDNCVKWYSNGIDEKIKIF